MCSQVPTEGPKKQGKGISSKSPLPAEELAILTNFFATLPEVSSILPDWKQATHRPSSYVESQKAAPQRMWSWI